MRVILSHSRHEIELYFGEEEKLEGKLEGKLPEERSEICSYRYLWRRSHNLVVEEHSTGVNFILIHVSLDSVCM